MVKSEEIIERTFYISLLNELLKGNLTLNPDDYLPITEASEKKFNQDKEALPKFVYLFGVGNNQVRGAKFTPRITIELNGYFPGDIGVPHVSYNGNTEENSYQLVEYPWEVKDITLDVHLVANNQVDMRMLHGILFSALPTKAYIAPYLNNDFEEWKKHKILPEGNLFIELTNYYDHPNLEHGLLEKVYTYLVKDGILEEQLHPEDSYYTLTPIRDISALMSLGDTVDTNSVNLHVPD